MKLKCILKHLWNGFSNGLVFSAPPSLYTCPHCCKTISRKEYYERYLFSLGCENCRDEHIYTEMCESGFSHTILDHMDAKLKELE